MVTAVQTREPIALVHHHLATSTEYERESLGHVVNLSDGHARQPLTATQQAIVDRAPQIFRQAQGASQFALESSFVQAFLHLAGEPQIIPADRSFLSYSSSSAIGMIAHSRHRHGTSVALIEPIYDNIPDWHSRPHSGMTRSSTARCYYRLLRSRESRHRVRCPLLPASPLGRRGIWPESLARNQGGTSPHSDRLLMAGKEYL